MINRRLIQELRQDMKSLPEFRGLDLSPRNVREYLASKILNEMTEKPGKKKTNNGQDLSATDKKRIAAIKRQLDDETIDNELRNDLLYELSGYGEEYDG